jgi:formate--tetrahydrofolate ligase
LGPFANISHGCNSVAATKFALSHKDYCVTEAGFGSDLGAEKFIDIKSRVIGKTPDAVVLVVVLEVIKEHGDGDIVKGFENVKKHIQNLRDVFKVPFVVAINKHTGDDEKELDLIVSLCTQQGAKVCVCDAFTKGCKGCLELAKIAINLCEEKSHVEFVYELEDSIKTKIEKIAKKVYGAKKVTYSDAAKKKLALAKKLGYENFFVNIAKTQFSFSDDKNLLGAPSGFEFHITDIELRSGAEMIVPIAGDMLLMPGLSKEPNYLKMNIDKNSKISGIF